MRDKETDRVRVRYIDTLAPPHSLPSTLKSLPSILLGMPVIDNKKGKIKGSVKIKCQGKSCLPELVQ